MQAVCYEFKPGEKQNEVFGRFEITQYATAISWQLLQDSDRKSIGLKQKKAKT